VDTITIATGYQVEKKNGWENHLAQAILGEIAITPVKEKIYDFDDGLRLAVGECDRVCKTYGIPFSNIFFRMANAMIKVLEKNHGFSLN
jgi:hypothetical protein